MWEYSDKEYIKVFRKLVNWEWYTDTATKSLFLHCLLKANWKPTEWRGIHLERGQFVTSLASLAKETGLTIQQTRTALNHLISTNELTSKSTSKNRVITVVSYDKYQGDQQTNQQAANKQLTNNQQATNNRYKNNKNLISKEREEMYTDAPNPAAPLLKIKYGIHKNVLLAVEEYDALVEQYGAEQTDKAIDFLSDHIQQNGYSAKSHAYALKRWVFDAVREADIKKQELDQRESRIRQMGKKAAFDIDTYEPQIWDFGSKKKKYEQG